MNNIKKCQEFTLLKTLWEKNAIKKQYERVIKNNQVSLRIDWIDNESKEYLEKDTINTKKQLRELEEVIEQISDRIRTLIAYSDKQF